MSTDITCDTCFDTEVIDYAGGEIACPDCQIVEIKLTGLSHGMGTHGVSYATAVASTSSTITFRAPTRGEIIADARRVLAIQTSAARRNGRSGRNAYTSWAIAILNHLAATK